MKSTKTGQRKPKLNVRLLRKIQKHILEEPRRFLMADVVVKAQTQDEWSIEADDYPDMSKLMPPCKTAACIAGWANLLTGAKTETQYLSYDRAVDQLGLVPGSPLASGWFDLSTLFFAPSWPEPYRTSYEKAETPAKRANVACARIDHLIKTGQ
jgi:hypothetical protein